MRTIACLLAICFSSTVALPQEQQRIAGGTLTTIAQYPFSTVILFAPNNVNFRQECGGTILNNRSVLTAAHCILYSYASQIRIRAGSNNANSGGSLYNTAQLIGHPYYNTWNRDSDIAIVRIISAFSFGPNVRAASIAGPNYVLADNQYVWATGWGVTYAGGYPSEQLRHVQLRTTNQVRCQNIYGASFITQNMLCAGWDAGGRGSCAADSGSPLIHNYVAVGVTSFTGACGDARYPSVYTRITRFTNWIQVNA